MRRIVVVTAAVAAVGCGASPTPEGQHAAQGPQEVAHPRPVVAREPETVLVRGGTFTMGTPIDDQTDPEYHADEAPIQVTVRSFRIGRTPITAEEYCAFLNSRFVKAAALDDRREEVLGSLIVIRDRTTIVRTPEGNFVRRRGAARSPAGGVTWVGAVSYCMWLSQKLGGHYRLPSEAEWELAARGTEGRLWPWGKEKPTPRHGYRWVRKTYDKEEPWVKQPVGSFPAGATPEGVHDLLGYYGEWCVNLYKKYKEVRTASDVCETSWWRLNDDTSPRVVKGPYNRKASRPSLAVSVLTKQSTTHPGRVWTREPGERPRGVAAFRVVEELPRAVPDAAGAVEAAPAKTD